MTLAGARLRATRLAVAGLVLASSAGLAVATGTSAVAADRTQADATGDPVRTTFDYRSGDDPTSEPAPNAARADLTSTRFDYRRQVLVVRGTARAAGKGVAAQLRIRSAGRDYYFTAFTRKQVSGFTIDGNDAGEVMCPRARYNVNNDRGTYQLRIPAGCFGSPDSARIGFALSLDQSSRRQATTTFDDANRTGSDDQGFGFSSRLGRALARG